MNFHVFAASFPSYLLDSHGGNPLAGSHGGLLCADGEPGALGAPVGAHAGGVLVTRLPHARPHGACLEAACNLTFY